MKGNTIVQLMYSGLGGHGGIAFNLAKEFDRLGYKNEFVFYGIEDLRTDYKDLCEDKGWAYHYVQKKNGVDLKSWKRVIQKTGGTQGKLVICHSTNLILPMVMHKVRFKSKILFVEHTSNACKSVIEKIYSTLICLFFRRIVILKSDYFFNSGWLKILPFLFRRYTVISNGIDVRPFRSIATERVERQPLTVGMAARFTAQRDFKTLIHAVQLFNKNQLETQLKLILAGDGPEKKKCEQLVEDESIDFVEFVGELDFNDLLKFYGEVDIYVQSSKADNMSVSVIQSTLAGCSVLLSDISGNKIFKTLGLDLNYFALGNKVDLCKKLEVIQQSDTRVKQVNAVNSQMASTLFSSRLMATKYLELLLNG